MRQPGFEIVSEDVLELASSLSLTEVLQAADLDVRAEGQVISTAEASLHTAQSLLPGSMSIV